MSEPTREQIEALAHVLDRPHGKRGAITTNHAIAQDAARRIFAAGYAPPERLREVEAERDAALGDARAGAGAAHWWDQR